jgi:hypothetical protein
MVGSSAVGQEEGPGKTAGWPLATDSGCPDSPYGSHSLQWCLGFEKGLMEGLLPGISTHGLENSLCSDPGLTLT